MEKIFQSSDPLKVAQEQDEEESSSGDVCLLQESNTRGRRNSTLDLGRTKAPKLQRATKSTRTNGG